MKDASNKKLILDFMKEHNLTKKKFCEMCGIGVPALNKFLNNNPGFRISLLSKIAKLIGVEIKDLFVLVDENETDEHF